MNFWQRRKVLKGVNYLELTPLRRYNFEQDDEKVVTILVPRFENKYLKNFSDTFKKQQFVNFKLDKIGSQTWLLIDGEKTVQTICDDLKSIMGEGFVECEQRVTKFLTQLYLNKFISFKEIE
jgi:glutaredoxin 2